MYCKITQYANVGSMTFGQKFCRNNVWLKATLIMVNMQFGQLQLLVDYGIWSTICRIVSKFINFSQKCTCTTVLGYLEIFSRCINFFHLSLVWTWSMQVVFSLTDISDCCHHVFTVAIFTAIFSSSLFFFFSV